jgi:hypothetical protein
MKLILYEIYTFIFCLLINFCCIPKSQTDNEEILNYITFDIVNGHCIFDGNINNKSAKFCIDNGSGTTMIDSAFFFSQILDTNKFTLTGLKRPVNLYTYNGELQIGIGGVMYGINEFGVISLHLQITSII